MPDRLAQRQALAAALPVAPTLKERIRHET
jgi:hypothetical protein